jgi:hypothetical protein
MSGTLQSLLNPLDMQDALPTSMSLRKDLVAGSTYWSETTQYYANDVVFSPLNDGAYVMWGGAGGASAWRGGDDPSLNPDFWLALTSYGTQTAGTPLTAITPATVTPVASVYTFTAGAVSPDFYDGVYVTVTVQGTMTGSGAAGVMAATDYAAFTATASGTGGGVASVWTVPATGATGPQPFSVSWTVQCGTSTTPATDKVVTLTAASGAATTPLLNNLRVTWTPLNYA